MDKISSLSKLKSLFPSLCTCNSVTQVKLNVCFLQKYTRKLCNFFQEHHTKAFLDPANPLY